MSRSFVVAVSLTFALTAVSASATAGPSPEALAQGTALHNRAAELLGQQKYREAAQAFLDAYNKNASPNELFNAGQAEMLGGRHKEALKLFNTYLDLPTTDRVTTEFRKRAAEKIAVCQASLCVIDVRGASETWVDGQKVTGIFYAEPGAHEVMMQGDAPAPKTVKVTCVAKQTVLVEYDDKKAKGPIGTDAPPPVTEKGSWLAPGVLAGIGVVGVGVGIGLGAASGGARSDVIASAQTGACANVASAPCASQRSREDTANGLATGSVIAYVGGGLFLAASAITLMVTKPWQERPVQSEKRAAVRLSPALGGLWIDGTF